MRRQWRIQHMGEHLGEQDIAGFHEKKDLPVRAGLFFSYNRKVLFSGLSRPMCDIVLGAEIERALRAIQRDEG